MTIRAKLYAAILLTILGPIVTIAVALNGMDQLGDRFDEVQERAERRGAGARPEVRRDRLQRLADRVRLRRRRVAPRFERSVRAFRRDLAEARGVLTDARPSAGCCAS